MSEIRSNLSGSAWHKTALARMCPQRVETPVQSAIEVNVEEWHDRTLLTVGGYELVVMKDVDDPRRIRFSGVNIRTMKDLLVCLALLTRARELMGGK